MTANVTDLTLLALLLPFMAAFAAAPLVRLLGRRAAALLALAPAASFLHLSGFAAEIAHGEIVTGGYAWIPSYNVSFSWLIDGLSLTFALLITGIGALIVLYSVFYLKCHPHQGRFLSFILLFMGAMLGLVMSDSFLMLFTFWELTSIASFLLIAFEHEREAARRAALQALVVTGGGGLALLAGLLVIWNVSGVTQMSLLLRLGDVLRASPFYLLVLLLVLCGAFTKSAQFPFHFWLPNAMEAPTPVSAYLHSATMVKAGVYLLMRLNPVLGGMPAWEIILPVFGGLTLVTGAMLGIRETDLKLMLAYTTVGSLGLMVLLIGTGRREAIAAAALYLVAHALFKGGLFMVAGLIDHAAGSRDVTKLSGLRAAMPVTFAAALAAAFSMAGLPPLLGFLAKEQMYSALAAADPRAVVLTSSVVLGNALMVAAGFAVALKPFLGITAKTPRPAHEGPVSGWLGPVVLGGSGLAAALFPTFFHAAISSPFASAVAGRAITVDISLEPHIGAALALSLLTAALSLAAYLAIDRLRACMVFLFDAIGPGLDRGFDDMIDGLLRLSVRVTRAIQTGRLRGYLTIAFVSLAAILLATPLAYGELPALPAWPEDIPFHEAAFFLIAIVGLVSVLITQDRLTAIVSLGIQGFAVAVIFLLFGAPDLAFTQFMVETLSVVILALVMTRLNLSSADRRPVPRRLFDGAVAVACGLGLALALMKATENPLDPALSDFYNAYAKAAAHGANVVNVIIVDFRATDTLGEIAVVLAAGLAILALIRLRAAGGRRMAANDPDAPEADQP